MGLEGWEVFRTTSPPDSGPAQTCSGSELFMVDGGWRAVGGGWAPPSETRHIGTLVAAGFGRAGPFTGAWKFVNASDSFANGGGAAAAVAV